MAGEVPKSVATVTLATGVPVILGVLTTDTTEQVVERAGTRADDRTFEAVMTAIEITNLLNIHDETGRERAAGVE